MSKRIYQDGQLKYTLTSTDGTACEIVVMPKVLVKDCSLTAEGFDEVFFSFLKGNVSHTEAYQKAEALHEHYFGKQRYKDYEVFKSAKSRRLNK